MIASVLLLVMLIDVLTPTVAYALTGGPSQPEVESFKAADAPEMVDLFTGDMSYNLPIMDVEGYPINLAYSAGVSMDQEASWVGLGWNLSAGQVERSVRGLPDDFAGDIIHREMNLRANRTVGTSASMSYELLGFQLLQGISWSVSPSFNNQAGVKMDLGVTLSMRSTKQGESGFTGSLGVSASSSGSLQLQPTIGYDKKMGDCGAMGGINFGLTLDSQEGLQGMSFGTQATGYSGRLGKANAAGGQSFGKSSANLASSSFDFGSKTYTPLIGMSMDNLSISAHVSTGAEAFGGDGGPSWGFFYSVQKLASNTTDRPAYGYLNLEKGELNPNAVLDFSREKDGPYTPDQTYLPVASLDPDGYTVTGQNMGGSFRPYRSAVGHVFDARTTCQGSGGSLGAEVAAGGIAHFGGDIIVNDQHSWTGDWTADAPASSNLRFGHTGGSAPEKVFFREANEPVVDRDPAQYVNYGAASPKRLTLDDIGGYNASLSSNFDGGGSLPTQNALTAREPRGMVFSYLTHHEVEQGIGLDALVDREGSPMQGNIPDHHMSEISITAKDGSRNFYGLPAYNITQSDVTFAKEGLDQNQSSTTCSYTSTDASTGNTQGRDYFFSKNSTPAHAYAYLLTAAVSPDYSDVDGVKGPSNGDLGNWTKFKYALANADYPWRTPAGSNTASAQPGLAYAKDDRANYAYGSKEIWNLKAVEGKNLIAIFFTSERYDALGVNENGTVDQDAKQMRLDSISLYTKELFNAADPDQPSTWPVPIKTAHFDYDYALCQHTPNSIAGTSDQHGKLTLRKVYFTYGKSRRGETSPYVFQYGNESDHVDNPYYDADSQDRWGGLRPGPGSSLANESALSGGQWDIPVKDFPYSIQDRTIADRLSRAWKLTDIKLPSGGMLKVAYESDDYVFVQNARPTSMVRLSGASFSPDMPAAPVPLSEANYLRFPVAAGFTLAGLDSMLALSGPLYYRMKVDPFGEGRYDYVSGYAEVADHGISNNEAWIKLKGVAIDKNQEGDINPIYRSAIEFARLNYPDRVFQPSPALTYDGDSPPGDQFVFAALSATLTLLNGLGAFFTGPNADVTFKNPSMCQMVDYGASYIRLMSPKGVKLGGGYRVRSVEFSDNWANMHVGDSPTMSYGKRYEYVDTAGKSSGVTAYEPMIGADENCLRRPVYSDVRKLLTPDQRFYQEEPFAESLYPSPVVGYARVQVSDYVPVNGTDLAPPPEQSKGRTVHEFYTAADFPVIARTTGINQRHFKPPKFDLLSLFGFKTVDNMHVSEGYSVEVNDMHGKPRRNLIYPEGSSDPISVEEFKYAMDADGAHLSNTAKVIEPDGTVHTAEIGRHYEFLGDFREFGSDATSSGVAINTDVIMLFFPLALVVPFPKFSSERTRFKSATFIKKIQRFALLNDVVKTENGRTVHTRNIAYDALTGNPLVTSVDNDFTDPVYSMTFPAYWYYDGMGPAYENIGLQMTGLSCTSGIVNGTDLDQRFAEGDEVLYWSTAPLSQDLHRAWVEDVQPSSVRFIDEAGAPLATGTYGVRITRSGRRNMQSVPMTTITTLSDPLDGLTSNIFGNLLTAQAVEYKDQWRTACECLGTGQIQPTHNPFRLDLRGVWRLSTERAWLCERTRSIDNNNSNIRRDGVYTSYAPFYKLDNGSWTKDAAGWVATREVTDYNIRGQELENRDALGIFSSASFGQRGGLPKSVAKNALYRQQGFDDFEDPVPFDCGDRHFRFVPTAPYNYTTDAAHTGRYSIRVDDSSPAVLSVPLVTCAPRGCTLSIASSSQKPGENLVSITGGAPPYLFDPVTVSGTITYTPLAGGTQMDAIATGTGTFQMTVTDSEGCQTTMLIQVQ